MTAEQRKAVIPVQLGGSDIGHNRSHAKNPAKAIE
jgi:hypothetical protein